MPFVRAWCVILALTLAAGSAWPAGPDAGSGSALRASYEQLRGQLDKSPFGKPLLLTSTQGRDTLTGDIHAVLDQPFERVRAGLATAASWCDALILHPNITSCQPAADGASIFVQLGKHQTPARFSYELASSTADYLHVKLFAAQGPAGTSDYHVDLEGAPLEEGRTMLHLVYSHGYGMQARLAMGAYLNTFGKGKVGFTVVGHDAGGGPVYVHDLRGALERNAMRYYLCIDAYLQSLAVPPAQRFEKRLQTWYAYTERYPLQLREEGDYLALKRSIARAQ